MITMLPKEMCGIKRKKYYFGFHHHHLSLSSTLCGKDPIFHFYPSLFCLQKKILKAHGFNRGMKDGVARQS
ncbi:hypothetical protein, partial [Geobacillus kaustophilus]|uniref:hypothetical protein n=1 Tax=Geobacillus kaustophilus TaxID=1462 RepID=UPI001E2FCCBD